MDAEAGMGEFANHYDDLIVAATTTELMAKGFLSPFRVFAPSHPDLSSVKVVRGDYDEGQLSKAMNQPALVGDIVSTWLRLGEDRRTLCFAVDRAHARRIADEFEAAGVPTGYVDANTPAAERVRIGKRLREGQIKVVCNVFCLTTGVDWDVRCIILARPTKSEILYTQIIGRGLRTAEGKTDCLILDHSDTTLRLGFVTDIHHEHLDDGRHKKSRGGMREKPAPLPKECPKCTYLKPAGVHKCPECGFVPERQSAIETTDGDLVQLNGRRKGKQEATPHSLQEFYSMLLWRQRESGYKAGYARAAFKERWGHWPNGFSEIPKEPDAAFLNWEKWRRIAYAKRKEKTRAA
jgi:superfamily II DNA or RNA helicase